MGEMLKNSYTLFSIKLQTLFALALTQKTPGQTLCVEREIHR